MVKSDSRGMKQGSRRLIGWLVSYALDEKGVSFELRAGRFLVSSKEIDPGFTIVLNTDDISAPHLALSASPKHTLTVQDIFSEQGSFLVRKGSKEEIVIDGPVQVEHGDWIKIGKSNRFQVCLIDGNGK